MQEPTGNVESLPLKVAYYLVQFTMIFGFVAGGLLMVMIGVMWASDWEPTYSWLPLEVELQQNEAGDVVAPITQSRSIEVSGFKSLRVHGEDLPGLDYVMFMPVVLLGAYFWVVLLLRKFLLSVRKGQPFDSDNPGRLRKIGWIVALAGPAWGLLGLVYGLTYIRLVEIKGAVISPLMDFHFEMVVAGLVIVVIAEVYNAAVRLKTEADLTI